MNKIISAFLSMVFLLSPAQAAKKADFVPLGIQEVQAAALDEGVEKPKKRKKATKKAKKKISKKAKKASGKN